MISAFASGTWRNVTTCACLFGVTYRPRGLNKFLDSSNCFARLPKNTLPVSIISIHSFMLSFLLFLFKITRQRGSNFWEWIYFRQGLASEGSLSICCCCCFCLFHVPFSQLFQTPNVKQYPTMMEGFASCIRYAIRCPMEAMVAVRN